MLLNVNANQVNGLVSTVTMVNLSNLSINIITNSSTGSSIIANAMVNAQIIINSTNISLSITSQNYGLVLNAYSNTTLMLNITQITGTLATSSGSGILLQNFSSYQIIVNSSNICIVGTDKICSSGC